MGVLSARSFVAPFIDRKNLIAIILIAVFFAVYRFSGGELEMTSGNRPYTKPYQEQNTYFEDYTGAEGISPIDDLKKLEEEAPKTDNSNAASANLMNDMLHDNTPPAKKGGTHLDDIERSLGLR